MAYILWDIDGVFNPFAAADPESLGFTRFHAGFITWDLDLMNHAAWMRVLEQDNSFVWASKWGEESNALVRWFHLDQLRYPHIPLRIPLAHSGTWKLGSVRKWVEGHTSSSEKVVWVEDEVDEDAFLWAERRGNMLIVKTDPAVGLTEGQYDQIVKFTSP